MAEIDWPLNPNIGDLFTQNGKTWRWNGYACDALGEIAVGPTGETGASVNTGPIGAQGIHSEKLYVVIDKYLTLSDAGDLIKITHKLFDLYKSQGIRGTLDGNAGEGLFNFLESTPGTSYENVGLEQQGYNLNTGTYSEFITELMDVLREGNY